MKQRIKTGRRTLASLMLLAVSLTFAFNGSAKLNYRGFVEGGLGAAIIGGAEANHPEGFRDSNNGGGVGFSYMLATTHGIQLKNNFFGIGLGIAPSYYAVGDYSLYDDYYDETHSIESLSDSRMSGVSCMAYLNWRYDFFGFDGSFKPYVGVKAGAFISTPEFEVQDLIDGYSDRYFHDGDFTPYFAVDFGLRKRLSESSGVSFGLSMQTSINHYSNYYLYSQWSPFIFTESIFSINILAKVAFDF